MTDSKRRALFRRMAKSGLYISNTMVNIDGLISKPYAEAKQMVDDTEGELDPRRKYVCGYRIQDWREQVEENKESPYDELRKQLPNIYRDFREIARKASRIWLVPTRAWCSCTPVSVFTTNWSR